MSSNFQHDFFDGQYSEKKNKKRGLFHKFSNQKHLPHIRVPAEYAVVLAIAALVLVIIAYAAGVERGKKISSEKTVEAPENILQVAENKTLIDTSAPGEDDTASSPKENDEAVSAHEADKEAPVVSDSQEEYAVYLASFKSPEIAESEVRKIKDEGFNADLSKKGSWFLVYVSGYKSMDEARKAKRKLTGRYRDCYVRKIK